VSLTSGVRTARATATKLDDTTSTIEAIGPSGLQVSSTVRSEDWTTVYPTGMRVAGTVAKHPKFGDQAPYVDSVTVTTPSGLAHRVTARETYEPIDEPQRVISRTTVNGHEWSSTLDLSTGVVSGVSPVGRVSQSEINALGQVMRTLGPNVLPTTYHYDARGRIEYTQQGDRDLHLEYDEHGAVRVVRDHDDPTTVYVAYTNDAIGRPTSIRPAATSHPISLQYDVSSNVTSLTTPRDDEHKMGYVNGALLDFYDAPPLGDPPMADRTRYEYNAHDQLAKIRTPAGQEIWFGYDEPSGRLGHVVEPGRTITLQHDAATGMLQGVDSTDGTALGFTYDGELPVFVTSSGVVSGAVSWTYNQDHSLHTESAANRTVVYQYDDDGLVSVAGEMTVHTDPNDGRLTGTTLAGVSDTLGYNEYGEVDRYRLVYGSETTPRYESDYEHDALGRIMTVRETVREADGSVRSTKARRYAYHPRGWLHQVYRLEPGGEETLLEAYTYDRNGNRTHGGAVHDAQDRLTQDNQYTYGYDGNGALARKSGAELTTTMHDVHGRLVSVASEGEPVVTYRLDALGRRIAKLVDGQVRYRLLYRSGLQPVAMQDGDGNDTARFVYAIGRNVPDYMIALESGGDVVYRIVTDERGSVRMVVRVSDGWVAQYMDYDEWGVVVEDTSEGYQPFGYAGGLYDPDTGLVHFGARDYDPQLGRWTSKDPIRFAGGDIGLYSYVGGDPINRVDPSGLVWWALINDDVRSFVFDTYAKVGFTVVDLLLGGSSANAPEGLTASRENSLRPEETLVRTAAGVVMVAPVARAAVAMVGQGLSRAAARGRGKVFFMDDGVLAPGQLAGTTASGEIYVAHARVFAAEARALGIPFRQLVRRTLRHELVHRFFAVPGLRGRIGMLGYKHSNLLKALEEGIAEGYGARSIGAGLREPFIPGQNVSRLGLGLEAGAYFGGIGTAIYLGATQ
jgi:RHS repeat-associated protein